MLETSNHETTQTRADKTPLPRVPEDDSKESGIHFSRRKKIVAGIALVATAVTGSIVGFAVSQKGEAPSQATSTSQLVEPTATSTPNVVKPVETKAPEVITSKGPESYDFNVTLAEVQPLLDESPEDFYARPVEERAMLALYYAQQFPEFTKSWMTVSEDVRDTLPMTISAENTPQEIIAFSADMVRLPYTIASKADNYSLDQAAANKALAAGLIKGAGSDLFPQYAKLTQEFVDAGQGATSARSMSASNYFPISQINSAGEVYVNAKNQTCRTINTTDVVLGKSYTGDSDFCLIKATNGQSLWMPAL